MPRERINYYLRCQPYADSPDGILLRYLLNHPVYDAKRAAFEAFEAFWKALAYQAQGAGSEEELRLLGIDCINSLLNQVDYICARLELDGEQLGAMLVSRGCAHLPGYFPSFVPGSVSARTRGHASKSAIASAPSRQPHQSPTVSPDVSLESELEGLDLNFEGDRSDTGALNLAGFDSAMLGPTFS